MADKISIPSIKRRIQKHTGIAPKDQNERTVSVMKSVKLTYDLVTLLFATLKKCQKFETVSSRCKTPSDFLNTLPTMMSELETHNKKFKFEEPELTPELVSQIWDD